jgi:hypothetical protein
VRERYVEILGREVLHTVPERQVRRRWCLRLQGTDPANRLRHIETPAFEQELTVQHGQGELSRGDTHDRIMPFSALAQSNRRYGAISSRHLLVGLSVRRLEGELVRQRRTLALDDLSAFEAGVGSRRERYLVVQEPE